MYLQYSTQCAHYNMFSLDSETGVHVYSCHWLPEQSALNRDRVKFMTFDCTNFVSHVLTLLSENSPHDELCNNDPSECLYLNHYPEDICHRGMPCNHLCHFKIQLCPYFRLSTFPRCHSAGFKLNAFCFMGAA